MSVLTPEEFAIRMRLLVEKHSADVEVFHIKADDLLCSMLCELGYDDGVNAFMDAPKWYA